VQSSYALTCERCITRSQAVARIADRSDHSASQHLSGSRDVMGHVTIWCPIGHFLLWSFGTESLSPANIFLIWRRKTDK